MSETRKGDWFVTFTGRRFYPLDPRVEDIDIRDIAHSLALQTRWNGHCKNFYSVASHSLACLRVVEEMNKARDVVEGEGAAEQERAWADEARWALMHDAAEAYTGDIIRPLKRSLVTWDADGVFAPFGKVVEEPLLQLIAERFGLPWPIPQAVHEIDNRMLVTEAVNLTNYWGDRYEDGHQHWIYEKPWASIKPYAGDHVLIHQTMEAAEKAFLELAKEYLSL